MEAEKKLFEFTGCVTYSVVVAAEEEDSARKAFNKLGNNWPEYGDLIGPDNAEDVELCDVRNIEVDGDETEDDMNECYVNFAHVVV